ncbi:MAG: cysteine synthase family protein [Actinobacteria bacterium]|nr:cysteine synthase family protein [Actinomycetota bacterium]
MGEATTLESAAPSGTTPNPGVRTALAGGAHAAGVAGGSLRSDPAVRRFSDIRELIGNPDYPTPLVRLQRVAPADTQLYLKLEGFNPFGSIKDRTALYLLRGMTERGELDGRELVEPTSGNTGIALAGMAALLGVKITVTIPDAVPEETLLLLRMLGAEVWPTPDDLCPVDHPKDGAIALAHSLVRSAGGERYAMANQYENPDNVRAHYETTGPEIWRQTEGRIARLFAGYGTCGTIVGAGRYLKERNPGVRVVAIEPERGHRLPGLKNLTESRPPGILDPSFIDEVVTVDDQSAYAMTKRLFREEGLIVGPSTGAIVHAATQPAETTHPDGIAVAISPDGGFKYGSFFADVLGDEGTPGV